MPPVFSSPSWVGQWRQHAPLVFSHAVNLNKRPLTGRKSSLGDMWGASRLTRCSDPVCLLRLCAGKSEKLPSRVRNHHRRQKRRETLEPSNWNDMTCNVLLLRPSALEPELQLWSKNNIKRLLKKKWNPINRAVTSSCPPPLLAVRCPYLPLARAPQTSKKHMASARADCCQSATRPPRHWLNLGHSLSLCCAPIGQN